MSSRLNALGKTKYPDLLLDAMSKGTWKTLADSITPSLLSQTELRAGKPVKVPVTANTTLAEGEFNRFYMRGVCKYALEQNIHNVKVYRARESLNHRATSDHLIGKMLSAESLLNDLRMNTGCDTALGLPPGPNSGLSVIVE